MTKFLKILLTIIFCFVLILININSVFAVEKKTGFRIQPALIEKTLKQGEEIADQIEVTNTTDEDMLLSIFTNDFTAADEEGSVKLINPESQDPKNSLSKWISLEKKIITLSAKERKKISYKINVPGDAESGGHYAVFFFQPASHQLSQEEKQVSIVGQAGSLLFINVGGNINYSANLLDFDTNQNYYYQFNPKVDFSYRIENLGATHIQPVGEIKITDWLGSIKQTINTNNDGARILPNSVRKFSTVWQPEFAIGPYTADLQLNYGNGITINKNIIFWIIPVREISIIIIIILLVIGSRIWSKSKRIVKDKK